MQKILKINRKKTDQILGTIENELDYYTAIIFHFSKLAEQNKSLYHLKITVNIINSCFAGYEGWILLFEDNEMVVIVRDLDSKQKLLDTILQVRQIFAEDELAFTQGNANPNMYSIFELPFNYNIFKSFILNKVNSYSNLPSFDPIKYKDLFKYSAKNLQRIEEDLSNINYNHLIRLQSCISFSGNHNQFLPKILFSEIYLSIAHLKQLLSYDFDLRDEKYLYKYITKLLDCHLMDLLMQLPSNHNMLKGPFSLNMSVEALTSDFFMEFTNKIYKSKQDKIILEIDLADILTDVNLYLQAAKVAKNLGYLICIDNINLSTITQVNRQMLNADFGKLVWDESFLKLSEENIKKLMNCIQNFAPSKLIMIECDNPNSIKFAQNLGILLFQGYECNKMLKKEIHT